jgi:hypothetical protein
MEIIKVFTKYDTPFTRINVPIIEDIVATPSSGNDNILTSIVPPKQKILVPVSTEMGLCGVRFVTYEDTIVFFKSGS